MGIQGKDQVAHKGKKIRISSDFDNNILCEKTIGQHKILEGRIGEPKILYPATLTFKCKGHKQTGIDWCVGTQEMLFP